MKRSLPISSLALPLLALTLPALSQPARAGELVWEGHYRARAQFFDSLSLSDTNPSAEGALWAVDHRLRLQPGWILSERVSLHTQLDLLPYVFWGDEVVTRIDPVTGTEEALLLSDRIGPPTSAEDGGATLDNIQVTRLWGEVRTTFGQVLFGRMPVHWGTGMVFNAGNDPDSEFGDTTDRVLVSGRAGDVFLLGGYEQRYEGYLAEKDDYRALVGSVLYQAEKAGLGIYGTYRFRNYEETKLSSGILDLWGKAELGPAFVEGELAAILGGGDLDTGANDLRLTQFGGNLRLGLHPDKLRLGVLAGFATGDANLSDARLRTFSFDPDFNVSLMLFEEPMPVLEPPAATPENGNRSFEAARTGYSISNAVFIQPRVGWQFRDDLYADLSYILAQQAKADEALGEKGRGYGSELDLNIRYEPFEHFWVQGTGAVFFPGTYYSSFRDPDLGGGFDQSALGGRLMTTIEF